MAKSSNLLQLNAGGVAMLEALGFLSSAWQLGESALRAKAALAQGGDPKFNGNIIAMAKFHDAHLLPQLHARLSTFSQAAAGIAEYSFAE
jgi:acyl-CoA dehydrogenase